MIKTKRHFRTNPLRVAVFVIFCVYAVVIAVPYLWAIICSLKTRYEYNESPIFALPQHPMFVNYVKAWTELAAEDTSVLSMLFNSIWYAVGRSVLGVMFSAMAAYVVARYSFPGRRFVYGFAIVTMMLPVMGTMASGLKFARAIGTYDSPLFVVLNATTLSGAFIILYSTFKTLSWGYAEAAFIDGAGHFRTFIQIMLPLVRSTIFAVFILLFIEHWNDYYTPMIFLPERPTMSYGLFRFQTDVKASTPIKLTACFLACIPILIVFAAFKDKIMSNVTMGGIKG